MQKAKWLVGPVIVLVVLAACASPQAAVEPVVEAPADVVQQSRGAVTNSNPAPQPTAAPAEPVQAAEPLVEIEAPAAELDGEMSEEMAAAAAAPIAPPQEGQQPDTMIFEDYGTNPFVDTTQDNLSTFAVDVDSGSYTLARSYLNDGILPPPEAIRLEEFVNYFDQDYPLPQEDAFNIVMEAAPAPFAARGNYVLRVGIQGYDVLPDQRPDATLIFVIDVSGSMDRGDRLGAVKQALHRLVDQLRPTDQVGIVVYGSTGRILLEPTQVGQNQQIRKIIDALEPDGSTNAEEGLRLAYQLATADFDPNRINRLILCSDGVANVGATGPDAILETVRQQAREGVTLTTVGFGMGNYNDVLMEQLANDGDGQYFYVDSESEATRIFVDRLAGTLQTIARDAKIQVEFSPEAVAYYRLMGYENRDVADADFRNDAVDAGEIGAGHSVTALYEVVPSELAAGVVATVRLRWEDPATGEVIEIERRLAVEEVKSAFEEASPRFRLDVAVAAFADALSQGAWAQSANLEQVWGLANQLADELPNDTDVRELAHLITLAMGLHN